MGAFNSIYRNPIKNQPTILLKIQGDSEAMLCICRCDHRELLISSKTLAVAWECNAGRFSTDDSLINYIIGFVGVRGNVAFESLVISSNFCEKEFLFSKKELTNHLESMWTISKITNNKFVFPSFI